MNIEEFARRMVELSPQVVRGFARYENNDLTKGKITLPQFWILDYLHRSGSDKMSSLAQYLNISPASTTGLIDRLMEQKLVTRKDDLHDRRIVWIELTFRGKDMILSIRKQKIQTLTEVFAKISSDDRLRYLDILERIVKIVNSLPRKKAQKQAGD